jgi:hypothetical protein
LISPTKSGSGARPARTAQGNLVKNGGYERLLTVDLLPELGWAFRKWCAGCRVSFTLLPEDVLPKHSYGLNFIHARVLASIDGVSLRSRDFYEDHGLIPPNDEALPWSDLLDLEPLNPSYQLFHQWRRRFSRPARVWLRALLVACVLSGCDLRSRLGESLEAFGNCPKDLHSLLLAAGLIGLLREQPVRASLRETLILVYGAASGSHKPLQASEHLLIQYGESLNFTSSGHT